MSNLKLLKRIQKFNQGRDRELLNLKYQRMSISPFTFFRGSCHLFYEDWQGHSILNEAPLSWICGDLHLQNFGCYEGENSLIYFDINDFDEAILAPNSLDIARLLTSIYLAFPAETSQNNEDLPHLFLEAYVNFILDGKARWLDRKTSSGLVKKLIEDEEERGRKKFLDSRTKLEDDRRKILIREEKTRAIDEEKKLVIKEYLQQYAAKQNNPEFYQFIDAAWRIAGTGSLGLERYVVLVEGEGSPDRNFLLDLKFASPASAAKYLKITQPQWRSQAERVVTIQRRVQAIEIACLDTIKINHTDYILRELQPSEDKIDLEAAGDRPDKLKQLIIELAKVVAWGQLRSSGRVGSANADELIAFVRHQKWHKKAIEYAQDYSKQVEQDWQTFCEANLTS